MFGLCCLMLVLLVLELAGSQILCSARSCYSKVQQSETACTGAGIQLTVVWLVGVQNVV